MPGYGYVMAMNEIGIADLKNRLSKHLRALGVAAQAMGLRVIGAQP